MSFGWEVNEEQTPRSVIKKFCCSFETVLMILRQRVLILNLVHQMNFILRTLDFFISVTFFKLIIWRWDREKLDYWFAYHLLAWLQSCWNIIIDFKQTISYKYLSYSENKDIKNGDYKYGNLIILFQNYKLLSDLGSDLNFLCLCFHELLMTQLSIYNLLKFHTLIKNWFMFSKYAQLQHKIYD